MLRGVVGALFAGAVGSGASDECGAPMQAVERVNWPESRGRFAEEAVARDLPLVLVDTAGAPKTVR